MFETLAIPGLLLYRPKRYGDARGYFTETWSERVFAAQGLSAFVQDNEALSGHRGTVRGLHYQSAPQVQAKLLRCVAGAIFDVVVDVRRGSPTFGEHVAMELRPDTGAIYVPAGFAHGYCTLVPDTLIQYKVDKPYTPECEGGIAWNDPALRIKWPVPSGAAILSERDRKLPRLSDIESPFSYTPRR